MGRKKRANARGVRVEIVPGLKTDEPRKTEELGEQEDWDLAGYGITNDGHDYSKHFKEEFEGATFIAATGAEDATLQQLLEKDEIENLKQLERERLENPELNEVMALLESGSEDDDDGDLASVEEEEAYGGPSSESEIGIPDNFVVTANGGETVVAPPLKAGALAKLAKEPKGLGTGASAPNPYLEAGMRDRLLDEELDDSEELDSSAQKGTTTSSNAGFVPKALGTNPAFEDGRKQRLLDEQFDMFMEGYEEGDSFEAEETSEEDEEKVLERAQKDLRLMEGPMDEFLVKVNDLNLAERARDYARLEDLAENVDGDDERDLEIVEVVKERDEWDCETVLSTYSNLDNHPKLIAMPAARRKPIVLDQKLKAPAEFIPVRGAARQEPDGSTQVQTVPTIVQKREKGETPEQRRERKEGVKAAKRDRRNTKKEMRQEFQKESTRQARSSAAMGTSKVLVHYS
ncbi:hypothetical protein NDN08_004189 [Rhodosorus marinus]|uniref:Protein LTV1 homolog n=1 Tax=Rhodosorus marinus TaxID=101924 RepID=A0AAV8ULJ7_9RHOD|nr:hypothetical protein NDN08_004189 [Rhodosorus marinus]